MFAVRGTLSCFNQLLLSILSCCQSQEYPVASVCDVCGKGPGFGHNVSHSHRRTNRRWNPNIQSVRTPAGGGNTKKLKVCTSCIKAGKVVRA
ncbi:hypothetical protein GCM10020358_16410 [Amorphoplanes nipponensis]|uniref:Large ribosomal subunit protein bL28 n=1 Tax=Actinoplanes nipponensis TaxID=135950 RepID=A0A919JP88_9ACTN|nr:hypothetical protein Ani05nite_64790 [Actinoplanes nipponensis]